MPCPFVRRRFQSKAYFRPFLRVGQLSWMRSFCRSSIIHQQHHHRHHRNINMDTSASIRIEAVILPALNIWSTHALRWSFFASTCMRPRERIHFALTPCDAPGRTSSTSGYWAVRVRACSLCRSELRVTDRADANGHHTLCTRQLLAATSRAPVHKYWEPASEIATYI